MRSLLSSEDAPDFVTSDEIEFCALSSSRTRLHCQSLPSPPPPPREHALPLLMTKVMFQVARKIPKILAR
ncbi:hypothetical protein ALC56_07817 [Trachymyrmex septentrionalis]|uniref:Uncharacterized protein n=1 Tax=Trachymyrmex septentrionalis TaxID=34720 RepID=A0A195FB13_9HYME|nr:hypothetical protein ALC56_07817 [Trachymyrmex septentrionalis]